MTVFIYPSAPHQRRHAPHGYSDYSEYKDWLRDDFCFTCVYCRCRERWHKEGECVFSVEHLQPKSTHPELECVYQNLVYACVRCNVARGCKPISDPCEAALGIRIEPDGVAVSISGDHGNRIIDICNLNETKLVDFRKHVLDSINVAAQANRNDLLDYWYGYPLNMPNLTRKTKCQNAMPGSADTCYFMLCGQEKIGKRY